MLEVKRRKGHLLKPTVKVHPMKVMPKPLRQVQEEMGKSVHSPVWDWNNSPFVRSA